MLIQTGPYNILSLQFNTQYSGKIMKGHGDYNFMTTSTIVFDKTVKQIT
jgi:hypothetical protein